MHPARIADPQIDYSNPSTEMRTTPKGFSLIELLIVIAIIAVLAGITTAGFQRVRMMSDRTAATANLRAIGIAMQNYANDHKGSLPGPLNYGQSPRYRRITDKQLANFLWSYLDGEEPITNTWLELKAMTSPAYLRERDAPDVVIYLAQRNIHIAGQGGVPPFGYVPQSGPISKYEPLTLQQIGQYDLRGEWALQEVDQQHPDVKNWNTSTYLPEPIHGDVRMTLYFDWSVGAVPVTVESSS